MGKKVKRSAFQDRLGVGAIQQKVSRDLGWLFREQPTDDFGIDAQIEIVKDELATGRLIAVQIKSGSSYFKAAHPDGWWFALDPDDLEYWLEHSLPVVVMLYDSVSETAYWEVVEDSSVKTGPFGGKKILVPRSQQIDSTSIGALAKIAEGNPYELRIRQLRLALPWMRLLASGRRILLEAEEWINKTNGRGGIHIISVDEANEDRQELGRWFILAGLRPYSDVLPSLVPWAKVVLHSETYDDIDHDTLEPQSDSEDDEGDRDEREFSAEWRAQFQPGELRPYRNGAGEVDYWRLELVLNELGRGFLAVDAFAEASGTILTPRK